MWYKVRKQLILKNCRPSRLAITAEPIGGKDFRRRLYPAAVALIMLEYPDTDVHVLQVRVIVAHTRMVHTYRPVPAGRGGNIVLIR